MTDARSHWDSVYRTKAADEVSWYRRHLERSLAFIEAAAPDRAAAIIDVGGGESTLVDDLLARGYRDVTVLDVAPSAIAGAKARLGADARHVHWLVADITEVELPAQRYDVWHDRAVFHFLTRPEDRAAYGRQALRAVRPRGHVVVATFGPEGPQKCSGLPVVRYDANHLHEEFGAAFRLIDSATELHRTPAGVIQQFTYCFCRIDNDR
jgi:2-polyprenyl-3-methyl-5-hydroxy-6-metoxy-1,4-benzoquinol methylase